MPVPEGLADSVGAEVDDLQEVVTGAGEELRPLVTQIQTCDPTLELQLSDDALRPEHMTTPIT